MPNELKIAVSTADFLPATAWSRKAICWVQEWSLRAGFIPPELLVTRAVVARSNLSGPWTSVHEVWNPRRQLRTELANMIGLRPQARGMTPSMIDSLFFANGAASEQALLSIAERLGVPAVVSALESPVTGEAYASKTIALQLHPDLGKNGAHLDLRTVASEAEQRNLPVVLDTHHVRRRVRRHPGGRTEVAPPLPNPDDKSLGGIRAVWQLLGRRVCLVHVQFAALAELVDFILRGSWSGTLREFRDLLPEIASRQIPMVLEINPGWLRTADYRRALGRIRMPELMLRSRDRLAAETL